MIVWRRVDEIAARWPPVFNNQALFKRMPGALAIQPWHRLSARYSQVASGRVNAYVRGTRPDRTFYDIELPALKANVSVTGYTYRGY